MTWLIVALTAAAAGTVQTVTGFGAAVVLMLVLPHLFGVVTASALSTSICIALTASLAWKFRRKTDFRFIALPIAVFSLSSVVMINLIKSLDLWLIGAAFGAFLLALSLYYLLFAGRASLRPTRGVVLACSAVSGVFSGLFSIGGPMMALCLLPCAEDHEQYVGNMQTLFVVTNCINIAARVANGLYTVDMLPLSLVGIVFILLGRAIGTRLVRQLSAEVIKRAVYLFVGISGAMTLIENIL